MTDLKTESIYKIVIIGDSGTGKTAINHKFVTGQFPVSNSSTVGVCFTGRQYRQDLKLQFWDTAGQERFRSIVSLYFRNSTCIIMVYDITNRQSFLNIVNHWYPEIRQYPRLSTYLIGNKTDLAEGRQVSYLEARQFAEPNNLHFYEISAKTDPLAGILNNLVTNLEETIKNSNFTPEQLATYCVKALPLDRSNDHIQTGGCCYLI